MIKSIVDSLDDTQNLSSDGSYTGEYHIYLTSIWHKKVEEADICFALDIKWSYVQWIFVYKLFKIDFAHLRLAITRKV